MFKNLIGGEWVEGPRVSRNINPSDTRDVVGEFAQADAAQARQAIAAASQAQSAWGLSTPQQRFDILDAAGAEILARKAELGDLLAREEGKTLPEAIGEVARAGNIFKFFAGEALRGDGQHHVRRQDADRHLRQAVIDNNMPAGDATPLTVTATFLTGGVQKQLSSTTTVRGVR